ncbi:MAG: alpha/beta hydrolase [Andreesenia angusta]|nr:alpha/beta hydrolase [Andreesenia angusta]
MSIRMNIIELAIRLFGPKSFLEKSEDNFDKVLDRIEKNQESKLNTNILKGNYLKIDSLDDQTIYRIKRDRLKKNKVIFFLFGGGFVSPPTNFDFKYIRFLLKYLDCEFIMPIYPLFPKKKLSQIVKFTYKAYSKILEEYDKEQIIFLGFSSGASLCLYLLNYMNMKRIKPEYPNLMILSSPAGELPPNQNILKKMKELDSKDVILSPIFISELSKRLAEPEYPKLESTLDHNLKDFPPIKLLYGEKEIFYSYLPSFKKAESKYNMNIEYIIGKNMPHCWPIILNTPEGKEITKKIINIIDRS